VTLSVVDDHFLVLIEWWRTTRGNNGNKEQEKKSSVCFAMTIKKKTLFFDGVSTLELKRIGIQSTIITIPMSIPM